MVGLIGMTAKGSVRLGRVWHVYRFWKRRPWLWAAAASSLRVAWMFNEKRTKEKRELAGSHGQEHNADVSGRNSYE